MSAMKRQEYERRLQELETVLAYVAQVMANPYLPECQIAIVKDVSNVSVVVNGDKFYQEDFSMNRGRYEPCPF